MKAPLYTTEILRLAASLPPVGSLPREDGKAELRSPTCGSTIRTIVAVDGQGRIEALSQEVQACAFGQAAAALVAQGAIGRSRGDIEDELDRIGQWLAGGAGEPGWGIEALAPARARRGRHGAILLPFRALAAALGGPVR